MAHGQWNDTPEIRGEDTEGAFRPFCISGRYHRPAERRSNGLEKLLRFPETYKRIRIAYIEAARSRPEEFGKRLNHFICKTKENKTIRGFGGIEKYYSK